MASAMPSDVPVGTSGEPTVLDTIVVGATTEMLHALQIAAAPMAPSAASLPELTMLTATARFEGSGCSGNLYLACPPAVVALAEATAKQALPKEDWICELTNQLMGSVRNRMQQFGVSVRSNLPLLVGDLAGLRGTSYRFRTVRGIVVVLLQAKIDIERLVYQHNLELRKEGDVILF